MGQLSPCDAVAALSVFMKFKKINGRRVEELPTPLPFQRNHFTPAAPVCQAKICFFHYFFILRLFAKFCKAKPHIGIKKLVYNRYACLKIKFKRTTHLTSGGFILIIYK